MTPTVSQTPSAHRAPPSALRILGRRVDRLNLSEALERIAGFAAGETPHQVVTVNPLMLLAAQSDPILQRIIDRADLVVPESSGVAFASRLKGLPVERHLPGIDLFMALCEAAAQRGEPIYLLGAKPGVAEAAAQALRDRFPTLTVAGTQHGYFSTEESEAVVASVRAAHPVYLFVALAVPHQERWIAEHLQALNVPVVMGVGGSFDVLSGRLKRAPRWMQRLGIEWLFRLIQEPWRWRRMKDLPVFVWRVWRETW
jgi:N-acetylglucosaminyldiphosphoundecaprenol N-acetyl-beta-D-mannosaminyltransferase